MIFVLVMLTGLLWNSWSFLILVSIIHFGCWIEFLQLTEKIHAVQMDTVEKYFLAVGGYMLVLLFGVRHYSFDTGKSVAGIHLSFKLLLCAFVLLALFFFLLQNKRLTNPAKWMVGGGFVYISLSLTAFLHLRNNTLQLLPDGSFAELGRLITCGLVFSIWINDTMAYLVGSMIGRTPFSKISPKKTWEGTAGGALLCVAAIGIAGYYIPVARPLSVWHWVAIAAICAVFGTMGDLFESKLKRMADVKDSGSIMPGHGGFLDRFDSMLWAAPAVWLYVQLFV